MAFHIQELDAQLAYIDREIALRNGAGQDSSTLYLIRATLVKHRRAGQIMQELERDIRAIPEKHSFFARSAAVANIILTKWAFIKEMGSLFLNL